MGWPYQQKPPLGWPLDYDSGLVPEAGYWLSNEGSGSKVADLSGNGRTGILQEQAVFTASKFGSGILCDGVGDGIRVSADFGLTNQYTFVVWVYSTDWKTGDEDDIISDWADSDTILLRFDTSISPDKIEFYSKLGTGGDTVYGGAFNDTLLLTHTWYQIATVIDGSFMRLYVNDIASSTTVAVAGTFKSGTNTIDFGFGGDEDWTGTFDHILFYNRGLSASEIAQLYSKPFCMFKDPAEIALLGGYQAVAGINMPLVMQQMNHFNGGMAA